MNSLSKLFKASYSYDNCPNFSRLTSASGLFVKDVIRPYIEAGLNLVTSIIAVQYLGIAGVFVGMLDTFYVLSEDILLAMYIDHAGHPLSLWHNKKTEATQDTSVGINNHKYLFLCTPVLKYL